MDFNIACALHFASKGEGVLFDAKNVFESPQFEQLQEDLLNFKNAKKETLESSEGGASKSYDYGLIS